MRQWLRAAAENSYRLVGMTGVLRTPIGEALLEGGYEAYKSLFEARAADRLRPFVVPETWVIDVGASIGYFTKRFGQWVRGDGRVLALEPEPASFRRLVRAIGRAKLESVVEALPVAAAETRGNLRLMVNPHHPADHRLGENGIPIDVETVDSLLASRKWPPVSLIKIDVQGAECRVLAGARATIERSRPALYVEVCDAALRDMNASAGQLLDDLADLGYRIFLLEGRGSPSLISRAEAVRLSTVIEPYRDFLFLPSCD